MHQTQWSAERPLPPPVSLASQSHHEKPPEVSASWTVRKGNEPVFWFPKVLPARLLQSLSLGQSGLTKPLCASKPVSLEILY